jgi:hypothetical protein
MLREGATGRELYLILDGLVGVVKGGTGDVTLESARGKAAVRNAAHTVVVRS